MKYARDFVAMAILVAAGCAHEEHAYSFTVPDAPEVVLASAQSQLWSQGRATIQESPTRLVTPWQAVGHEQTIMSTDTGGPFEPVVDWRRFAISAQPGDAGTKVTVREDKATCPPQRDRWSKSFDQCVRESRVSGRDQQAIEGMGRNLQARLTGGAG